jgi:hypothetical protein
LKALLSPTLIAAKNFVDPFAGHSYPHDNHQRSKLKTEKQFHSIDPTSVQNLPLRVFAEHVYDAWA